MAGEDHDQQQDRNRIEHDSEREAAAGLPFAPQTSATDARQEKRVEEHCRKRRESGEGRAERAHGEGEAADRHVHRLAAELAGRQAGHAPVSLSQATVVSRPARRLLGL